MTSTEKLTRQPDTQPEGASKIETDNVVLPIFDMLDEAAKLKFSAVVRPILRLIDEIAADWSKPRSTGKFHPLAGQNLGQITLNSLRENVEKNIDNGHIANSDIEKARNGLDFLQTDIDHKRAQIVAAMSVRTQASHAHAKVVSPNDSSKDVVAASLTRSIHEPNHNVASSESQELANMHDPSSDDAGFVEQGDDECITEQTNVNEAEDAGIAEQLAATDIHDREEGQTRSYPSLQELLGEDDGSIPVDRLMRVMKAVNQATRSILAGSGEDADRLYGVFSDEAAEKLCEQEHLDLDGVTFKRDGAFYKEESEGGTQKDEI